jgi:hypothetical protein
MRIATNDRFFASLYWMWCGGNIDLDEIVKELQAPEDAIIRAGLCFRPRTGTHFGADVEKIADHAGIESGLLLGFVRAAEALTVFKRAPEQDRFLAAARDAPRDDQDE